MDDDLVCPNCDEQEELLGTREGETITITCQECGCVWDRDLTPRCDRCGSTEVRRAFRAVVDKSRGTQLSIQSMRLVYLCPHCDPESLRTWLDSNTPLPPDELPT